MNRDIKHIENIQNDSYHLIKKHNLTGEDKNILEWVRIYLLDYMILLERSEREKGE